MNDCCSSNNKKESKFSSGFVISSIITPAGFVPIISAELRKEDILGQIRCRLTSFRDDYKIIPGIYAVGSPCKESDIFVSANYKLSFDILRKSLGGVSAWILVLDTKGINVWCAAGKGTFGTKELVEKINQTRLDKIVNHRKIILPQLGAAGVAAHEAEENTGFKVIYGPIRAKDIKAFVKAGYKCTTETRTVRFPLKDRLVLVPIDIYNHLKKFFVLALFVLFIFGLQQNGVIFSSILTNGLPIVVLGLLSFLIGVAVVPAFLPFIPFRSFALKGFFAGLLVPLSGVLCRNSVPIVENSYIIALSWILFPSISSYLALQFTGASTYTNISGVKKELKIFIPVYIMASLLTLILISLYKISEWGLIR